MSTESKKNLVAEFFADFKRKSEQAALDMMSSDATW